MAIITLPTISAQGADLHLIRDDQALEFYGGSQAIIQNTKALWAFSFPVAPKRIAQARAWSAALVQLSKLSNTFVITPPGWVQGANYGGAVPLVVGGSQLGLSLDCDNVSISTAIALAGDFISVNGEMKKLTAAATSNGAGLVTFNFEPALRNSPSNNAEVEVIAPVVTMRMLQSRYDESVNLSGFHNFTVDAIEFH